MKYIIQYTVETDNPELLFGPKPPNGLSKKNRKWWAISHMGTEPIFVATLNTLKDVLIDNFTIENFSVRLPEDQK